MAYEDNRSTWDKIKEEALNEPDKESLNEDMPMADDKGFRERLSEEDMAAPEMGVDDMQGMPAEDTAKPEYEAGDEAFLDRDSE
jgi:hypothetical protein